MSTAEDMSPRTNKEPKIARSIYLPKAMDDQANLLAGKMDEDLSRVLVQAIAIGLAQMATQQAQWAELEGKQQALTNQRLVETKLRLKLGQFNRAIATATGLEPEAIAEILKGIPGLDD